MQLFLDFCPKDCQLKKETFYTEKSVKLDVGTRDAFWKHLQKTSKHNYNHALVASSVGSYGADLADGSEYRCLFMNIVF